MFRFFFKRWGTPTISNSISALQELMSIKLPTHDHARLARALPVQVRHTVPALTPREETRACRREAVLQFVLDVVPKQEGQAIRARAQRSSAPPRLRCAPPPFWLPSSDTRNAKEPLQRPVNSPGPARGAPGLCLGPGPASWQVGERPAVPNLSLSLFHSFIHPWPPRRVPFLPFP